MSRCECGPCRETCTIQKRNEYVICLCRPHAETARSLLFSTRGLPPLEAAPLSRFSSLSEHRREKQRSQGATMLSTHSAEDPAFEPLQSANIRSLSLKTALLLALASVKRLGNFRCSVLALPAWNFGPNNTKVILKPKHVYVPKAGHYNLRASSF